jgi:hypothetical protein
VKPYTLFPSPKLILAGPPELTFTAKWLLLLEKNTLVESSPSKAGAEILNLFRQYGEKHIQ